VLIHAPTCPYTALAVTDKVPPPPAAPVPGGHTRLGLQISCEKLDWQLSSISHICDHFSSLLSSVEDLGIKTMEPSSVPDDINDEQWLRLIHTFGGAKDFRVASELVTDILHALRPANEGHKIVLPALRNLHVQESIYILGPLRDSVESFVTQRRVSSRPVQIYYVRLPLQSSRTNLLRLSSLAHPPHNSPSNAINYPCSLRTDPRYSFRSSPPLQASG